MQLAAMTTQLVRRLGMLLAAASLFAALLLVPIPSANAVDDQLQVSLDGTTWASALPETLFEDDIVLVPGGSASAHLHLRSAAPSAGLLDLGLTNVLVSGADAEKFFGLTIDVSGDVGGDNANAGLSRTRFADLHEGSHLGAPLRLVPGQSITLTVTIDLDDRAGGNRSQDAAIALDLAVFFVDSLAAGGDNPGDDTPSEVSPGEGSLSTSAPDAGPSAGVSSGSGNASGESAGEASGPGSPVTGSAGTGNGSATPQHVVPIIGPGRSGPTAEDFVPSLEPGAAGTKGEVPLVSEDPSSLAQDRGPLAVTGSSVRGALLVGLAIVLAGGALLRISRRRTQEEAS